jgi:hypothetical protein
VVRECFGGRWSVLCCCREMFRPLVVSCEFLASAMLHTCLKLRQPAAHAEKPSIDLQPNLRHIPGSNKSHCHL